MFGTLSDKRHIKANVGPWRGMETNVFDDTQSNRGAVALAQDVIFDNPKDGPGQLPSEGRGLTTSARVRPGRNPWLSQQVFQRFYLSDAEEGNTGWDANSDDDLTRAATGYHSRFFDFASASVIYSVKKFTAKDLTNKGMYTSLSDMKLTFWLNVDATSGFPGGSSTLYITSDAVPDDNPANWTDYLSKPIDPTGMADDTWTKFSDTLDNYNNPAAFDPSKVTALAILLETDGTNRIWADEVYVESLRVGHVVGMGEFYKPDTQDRFLFAKIGETIYLDKNHTGVLEKVVSNLDLNTPAYFQSIYNQCFVSDGTNMWVFDGTKSSLDTWNYRPIGFPAPSLGGTSAAPDTGGSGTIGNHYIGVSYIYGNGTSVYGQSNVAYIAGTVALTSGNQKVAITGLPVPPISAGVLRLRIFMGLAGDSVDAIQYFAADITAGTTTATIDLDDTTLSAPTNPIAPRDNNIPSTARYLLPYEGSLIYLRLDTNAVVGQYSARGVGIDSGPEIVNAGSTIANQNGQAWTGGITRNRALYLFTRRSIYKGGFTPQGALYLSQLEAENAGSSQFAGSLDKNCIWLDDEEVIHSLSESGWVLIDRADQINFFARKKLRDEWKDINDREAQNSNSYHAWLTEADWEENRDERGANMDTGTQPGVLTYQYANSLTTGSKADAGPLGASEEEGNYGYYLSYGYGRMETPPSKPALGSGGEPFHYSGYTLIPNRPGIRLWSLGSKALILFQAKKALKLSSIVADFEWAYDQAGGSKELNARATLYKYNYQLIDRTVPINPALSPVTNYVGGAVLHTDISFEAPKNQVIRGTFEFPNMDAYIPDGEMFWIGIENINSESLHWFDILGTSEGADLIPADNNLADNYATGTQLAGGAEATPFSFPFGIGSPAIRLVCKEVLNDVIDVPFNLTGADIERYGFTDFLQTDFHASGEVKIRLGVAPTAITTYTDGVWQALVGDYKYVAPGITTGNRGFMVMPASRTGPDATPPIIPLGYPNTSQNHYIAFQIEINPNSNYGKDIVDESQSLISTDYFTTFLDTTGNLLKLYYSAEQSFQEPLADDTWVSATIDMGGVPVAWGRFTLNGTQDQQLLHLEAATAPTDDFTAATWYPVDFNSVPTTANLPINGQFLRTRIRFEDDPGKGGAAGIYYDIPLPSFGISSTVTSLIVHWQRTGSQLRPMLPPAGCFFGQYSLLAYAPASSILNNTAWCSSPAYRLSQWTNQNVNCWCIYDGKLLAGMASAGMITQYWADDVFDKDSATIQKNIMGRMISHSERLGVDNVKTLSGITLFTGRREYMGRIAVPSGSPINVLPATPLVLHVGFLIQSGADPNYLPNYSVIITPALDYGYIDSSKLFGTSSGSTPNAIPSLSASYFFDLPGRQEEAFRFLWQASAHSIRIPALGGKPAYYRSCFPYLTKMVPEAFVENYGGVFNN